MGRCRRTDTIVELVIDPELGVEALSTEQREHVAICPDCHLAVEGAAELDRALAADLRSLRREALPTSILDTPPVPRADAGPIVPSTWLAAAAVAIIAVGIAGYGWWTGRLDGIGADATPTPVASSTANTTPSAEPSPTPVASPALPALPSLVVGELAAVVDEPLVVRTTPGTSDPATILPDLLWIGQRVRVLDGPADVDRYTWWEIQVGEITGWVADADQEGTTAWLAPIVNGRIAYSRITDAVAGTSTLFSAESDGTDERVLADPATAGGMRLALTCPPSIGQARWTHDGSRATFSASTSLCEGVVYVVNADGTGLVALGPGATPSWRPNGSAVAYAENAPLFSEGHDEGFEILVAEPPGEREPRALTDLEPGEVAHAPAWSPDRTAVALSASDLDPGSVASIFVLDLESDEARRLTEGQLPVWSPDGHWITYQTTEIGSGATLHRIRPDGSDEEALGPGHSPVFSPDGSRLAVVRDDGVWTMAPDGSDAALLKAATFVDGIDWSPDGTTLLVASAAEVDAAVTLSLVAAVGEVTTTDLGIEGRAPSWQPLILGAAQAD